ncbi:alpha/beta fold hydrolase [Anaerolinea thermophila]|uniref:AB hydrolase-1 domain-containing protein n=1 Tax=Anaerolinea thermophila (strain DSM 14523 / JCM 11388 / NBRC 100420 / UNI-1) TaxID=926569 RepID=E8N1U1_ANATU|nr:alpha/beta hydrolase [Anaerolinea thermophila]BAJ62696.1 hypothetical protein ANT_06620 [Anaerolinea thermophila UNI-1]
MSAILLDGQMVHYEVLGRGRPVIFLHGWIGSWRYWIPTMQAASIAYRAYALDFWGFGDSAKVPERYGLDGQVNLLRGFMDQMGIGRVALIGHGLGATVAVMFALRYPEVVDRVLAVAYPLDETRLHPRLRSQSPEELVDWLLERNSTTEPVRVEAAKTDPRAIQDSLEGLTTLEAREASQKLTCACLLVYGEKDPVVPAPSDEVFLGLPFQTHGIVFDQSGHFPILDESSKFNRLVMDFLSLGVGESPRMLQLKEEWKRRVR